ncbi:hypothetical protein PROFUN_03914 [Planoprotostelium fungivorum]|uniref:Uncharacterized protein n=1 Tax=Planoprotostelium fungivorum TaxID=1890364 RepID=A0A2P6MTQ0_9EUKA|nr:hypothetical protein PROFUN_03914 [Planoprotostelium fungivorum]
MTTYSEPKDKLDDNCLKVAEAKHLMFVASIAHGSLPYEFGMGSWAFSQRRCHKGTFGHISRLRDFHRNAQVCGTCESEGWSDRQKAQV